MQDGCTKKVRQQSGARDTDAFLAHHRAVIVTLAGSTAGNEYVLESKCTSVGRGPGVDLAFDDNAMSREHASFEVRNGAMHVRDLASTNGVHVNGSAVLDAALKHGDRIDLGDHRFQLLIEERQREPKAYRVDG
jgi:pSer/pThr/pTyr-binding forkhead associated (FHA) protein